MLDRGFLRRGRPSSPLASWGALATPEPRLVSDIGRSRLDASLGIVAEVEADSIGVYRVEILGEETRAWRILPHIRPQLSVGIMGARTWLSLRVAIARD